MLRIAQEALTFDDVLLVPGYSEVTAKDVSLQTRLSRNIYLNIPLVSAAMDTVTEARLAIALAQEGGIGIIHKSMTIEKQALEVRAVKKYESGVVKDPITINVNDSFELRGLITVKDIDKAEKYPNACKDDQGRLRVGASVGTSPDTDDRVAALVKEGVDVLVVDTAHGHSLNVIDRVRKIKSKYPDVDVIGGNIASAEAALALAEAGADGVKVGIGPGSICTTRIVTGIGVPQISAIANVVEALADKNIPVIADGGIRFSGDISKALAAGAHSVMMGSMFAGTEEAPGEIELYQGRTYKSYRGMGSMGAMSQTMGSSDRYFQDAGQGVEKLVPEGIEGRVPYKGPVSAIIHQMMGGVCSAMGYTGSTDIETLRTKPTFVRVTTAGMGESHVHDVSITKEAPNYPRR
ncbi:UNVERIFIED_CONTAM: hypothetical protein GTU68_067042 [Idotea baltica]|nr:hypothetical protein [Idotea baltica]